MRSRMSRPFSAFFCKMLLTLAQCFLKAGLLKLSVLDDGNLIIGFSHKLRWLGSLSFLVLVHTWYVGYLLYGFFCSLYEFFGGL